ncbi:MAG: rhodanese-like domain-containing protein [Alphaproteobacteria bacterium]|nr:rhodanese-like domain-containing protein [Alphaproteobacteria bacterium]
MASSVKDMMAEANREVPKLTPQEVREKIRSGNALLVDVRDGTEVRDSGKIRGAVNVARGMLEFRADPESPYHDPAFRKDRTVILYCASGGRSALAGKTLKDFGYQKVFNAGAFKDLVGAGLEIEARNE